MIAINVIYIIIIINVNFHFNKKNFAYDLLSQGLAVVNETNYNNKNIYEDEMLKNEKVAKEKKLGIWEDEGLANMLKFGGESYSVKSNKKYEEINKNIKIRVTEQIDMNNFYVNVQPNKILDTISNTLSLYDSGKKKGIPLETPIKNGTLCAALYPDDGKYYRGLIKSQNKKEEKYTVEFIDYGNIETLTIDDLIKLDGSISSYEPQSLFCELAYLKYFLFVFLFYCLFLMLFLNSQSYHHYFSYIQEALIIPSVVIFTTLLD